jgi:hypothetical protein
VKCPRCSAGSSVIAKPRRGVLRRICKRGHPFTTATLHLLQRLGRAAA